MLGYRKAVRCSLAATVALFPRSTNRARQRSAIHRCVHNDRKDCSVMELPKVVEILERIAPPSTAASWDNVGLLVEPSGSPVVKCVFLTNDLTLPVLDEAEQRNAQLIVSYHPPIFAPLRALRQSQWKERLVIRCLERGIAVYSPHTAWDAVEGGANDWLASCLGPSSTTEPLTTDGAGRRLHLDPPVALEELATRLRTHVGASKVRLALAVRHTASSAISRISLCAGSGISVLRDEFDGAELVITGEMSHHDILDATQRGASVLLCEHAVSERGSLGQLAKRLSREAPDLTVIISQVDTGPLQLV
ncbi:NIF3-like protein 1 [Rhipicephalus microplus]|uniref:NIF3-like protein 1 n=1 Tax=Rhipicephalus microplus TaxID=6941 RepID=UPI003F6B6F27